MRKRAVAVMIGIIIVLLFFIGAAMIWGGVLNFPAPSPTPTGSSSQGGIGLVVDPNASDEKYVAPTQTRTPGVAIPGFGTMTIPANTEKIVGINLENPKANEGWYYLTYKLSLTDNNGKITETLYESQLLPPGQYLRDIILTRGLAPGTYKAVLQVQPYRISDNTPTNNAELVVTIIAK